MKKIVFILFSLFSLLVFVSCGSTTLIDSRVKTKTNTTKYVEIYELQNSINDVLTKVNDSCIGIHTRYQGASKSNGAGIVYKYDEEKDLYYVITSYHVVEGSTAIEVYLGPTRGTYGASLVGFDATNDLCVIVFTVQKEFTVPVINLDANLRIKQGQFALAIGCPTGLDLYNSCAFGIVSGLRGSLIQTDASLNPGNSGGGLFDMNGNLVGIIIARRSFDYLDGTEEVRYIEGIGFAVNIETVLSILGDIENGEIKRPQTGMELFMVTDLVSIDPEASKNVPRYIKDGIIVGELSSDCDYALRAGVQKYDIITEVDDIKVNTLEEFQGYLNKLYVGDAIVLTIIRRGNIGYETTVKIIVMEDYHE